MGWANESPNIDVGKEDKGFDYRINAGNKQQKCVPFLSYHKDTNNFPRSEVLIHILGFLYF